MTEKKYVVRSFSNDDVFKLLEIYDKLDVDFENTGDNIEEAKMKFFNSLLRKSWKVKTELFELVANLTSRTVEEVANESISFTIAVVQELMSDLNFNEALSTVFTTEPKE